MKDINLESCELSTISNKTISLVEQSSYYWQGNPKVSVNRCNQNRNNYNMVDLFCGAGGFSIGFEMTNRFQSILGVDIYTSALKTYQHNHPNTSTILGDVKKISNTMYLSALGDYEVDVVTAGVPCQGFSISNKKRAINDERNFLFLEVIRFVNLVNPKVVIIENVGGMKSYNNGQFVAEIENALRVAGHGYLVKSFIVNAADYGVPQNRKRLIFVAISNVNGLLNNELLDVFFPPLPTHGLGLDNRYNTVWDAISDLPETAANEYIIAPQSIYQFFMRNNKLMLFNHIPPNHPQNTIEKIRNTTPGEPMYEKYKQRIRLHWDMLSPTQLAGGIRPQFQFGHPQFPRGLTIRERARIQSFPDNIQFFGGIVQERVQTGNAVPPLLAQSIAFQVANIIDIIFNNQQINCVVNL